MRQNLTVSVSDDRGASWHPDAFIGANGRVVEGDASYSCLVNEPILSGTSLPIATATRFGAPDSRACGV